MWSAWLLATIAVAQPSGQTVLLGTPVQFQRLKSRRSCQLRIPKLRQLCQPKWFSTGAAMEVAVADFDNDGLEDVAVRFRSRLGCGSHGCPTQLYHAQRDTFVPMLQNMVTDGPVARCRRSISGVAFPASTHKLVCFMFPGWTDKDMDPPRVVDFQGARFMLLTGPSLDATLINHSLTEVPCGDTSQCIEAFYERGHYAHTEDRSVIRGRYVVRQDRYCAGWDDHQFCKAVYQSGDGQLATTDLKCGVPCLSLVERSSAPRAADFEPLD